MWIVITAGLVLMVTGFVRAFHIGVSIDGNE